MKRMTVSVLALALSAVAGVASAGFQDYGSRYDDRYDDRSDNHYNNDRMVSSPRSDIATVVRVNPAYDNRGGYQGGYQRQECWNEQGNRYDGGYYRDSNGRLYRGDGRSNTSGATVLGALIGGALGNQVGKGDGRKAATIAGAVIGGAIANNHGDNRGYDEFRDDSGVVRRCRMVNDGGGYGDRGISGYNVTYRYAGQTYQAYTRSRPGRTIRVMVDVRPQDGVAYRH